MKYKDKNTLISHGKHLDRIESRDPWNITDRERRRIEKKNHKKFITKFVGKIEKDWWECLSDDDKSKIYREYNKILSISKNTGNKPVQFLILRHNVRTDIDGWISMIKMDFKPDVQLYRERKINKLLE